MKCITLVHKATCVFRLICPNTPATLQALAQPAFWKLYAAAELKASFIRHRHRSYMARHLPRKASALHMFACNGILFNHESPRRGETFVTRKITRALAHILSGKQQKLYLGNLDAKRDWGFAPEYVQMMWLMLQHDSPDDYAVGTGDTHTVREFVQDAFEYAGVELQWIGEGVEEKGIVRSVSSQFNGVLSEGDCIVEILPKYFRPTEVDWLQADITKARVQLQWEPSVGYKDLVRIMVDYDMLFEKLTPPMVGVTSLKDFGFDWIQQPLHNVTGGVF